MGLDLCLSRSYPLRDGGRRMGKRQGAGVRLVAHLVGKLANAVRDCAYGHLMGAAFRKGMGID
jgi:hypothetical protein